MNLRKYLTPKTIKMTLVGETPEEILREMVDVLCAAGKIKKECIEDAIRCLMRREKMMSTGMQHGIAIPHAKTDGVTDLVAALGVKRGGIDFSSLDGQPSTIFVMTLSPRNISVPHVPFLAEVAKILQDLDTCKEIEAASNAQEVIEILFE